MPVMAEFPNYQVKRADHDPRPGLIDSQLINDLLNAELVIADLSFVNPNVFYEIGIRHMAQKPISFRPSSRSCNGNVLRT